MAITRANYLSASPVHPLSRARVPPMEALHSRAVSTLVISSPVVLRQRRRCLSFTLSSTNSCCSSFLKQKESNIVISSRSMNSSSAAHSGGAAASTVASALPFDIAPPPIDDEFESMMPEDLENNVAETFADDETAIEAAFYGAAVMDLSHFGRLRVTGEDRVEFLHNQSTANFEALNEGEGCDTVFVTATARTIDIAYSWFMKNAILLLVSPSTCNSIFEMLNKYIFYADKVEVHDITKHTCFLVLVGPKSNQVMEALNLHHLIGLPYGTHRHYSVNGLPVTIGVGSVLFKDGFSFLMAPDSVRSVWKSLLNHGAVPMGNTAWERLRVLQGRPAPDKELTKEFNVLEAGLSLAVSLDKGCYKGQETISRIITYDGLKQKLWGIKLSGQAEPGSTILLYEEKVGVLTSYSIGRTEGEHVGLGYLKRKVDPAEEVLIGEVTGTLVEAPFLCYPQKK